MTAPNGGPPLTDDPAPPREERSLTQRTLRGSMWAFTGGAGQAVLQIASIILLARLLTPAEFGSAVAATLVVGISVLVGQLGVSAALVQRRDLTDQDVSASFYFSVALSCVLGAVLLLLAPVLNPLVGLPADSQLLPLLCASLPLAGCAAVSMGLLQRRLQFRTLAGVEVTAYAVGTLGLTVLLAALGVGAASVIWGQVAYSALTAVLFTAAARPALRPVAPRVAWRSLRSLLRFGAGYSLSQVGNWLAQNADNLVVANALGPAPLGIYSRAYRLLVQPANLVGNAVDRALFPAMAQVRDDGVRLRSAYVRAASLVALVIAPTSVLILLLAPEIVQVLLGEDWAAVVVPLQVFALVLLPRTSYKLSGSLTRATGAVYRGAWRQWLYAAEVFVGCVIGSRWGVTGVAVGASVAIVLHFLVMLHFSGRVAPGLVRMVLRQYLKHVPVTAAVLVTTYLVVTLVRPYGLELVTLLAGGAVGVLTSVASVALMRRLFREELGTLSTLVGSRLPGRARKRAPTTH